MAGLRGAKPTPRHKLQGCTPHKPVSGVPTQFAIVPTQLSFWDNDVDGDCVSAEECFAKLASSVQAGGSPLMVPTSEVIRWATKYGFLNGATLTDVMDEMQKDGFTVNGVNYKDGPYQGIDYSNETILQSAISQGTVKIGIDADALPSGAGNGSGWFSTTGGNFTNEDHCVSLTGYGPASYLFSQLGMPVPSGLDQTTAGYLLFTWSSIGFVTHAWIMGTCQEAWLRVPTTPGMTPPPNPPVCPAGQHWDATANACVPDGPPSPPPAPVVMYGQTQPYTIPAQTIHHGFGSFTIPAMTIPGQAFTTSSTQQTKRFGDWTAIWTDFGQLIKDWAMNAPVSVIQADLAKLAADVGL